MDWNNYSLTKTLRVQMKTNRFTATLTYMHCTTKTNVRYLSLMAGDWGLQARGPWG